MMMKRLIRILPFFTVISVIILSTKIWLLLLALLLAIPGILAVINLICKKQSISTVIKWWVSIVSILFIPILIYEWYLYIDRPYYAPPQTSEVENIDDFWDDLQFSDGYKKHLGKYIQLRCVRNSVPDMGLLRKEISCTLVQFKNDRPPQKKADLVYGSPISIIMLDDNNRLKRAPLGMAYGISIIEFGYSISIAELDGYFTEDGYFAVPYKSVFPNNSIVFNPFKYSVTASYRD